MVVVLGDPVSRSTRAERVPRTVVDDNVRKNPDALSCS
jgi:hypothetical protein